MYQGLRFLVACRLAGDPTTDEWWFLVGRLQVVTPLDERMKEVVLEARKRSIAVKGETPAIQQEIDELYKSAA